MGLAVASGEANFRFARHPGGIACWAARPSEPRPGQLLPYTCPWGIVREVATKDGRSLMGVWDPTGTRVAYSSINGPVIEAWVVAADGSGAPRQLTHDGGLVHVDSWSPDGRTVSVHRHPSSSTIQMIPVDRPGDPPVVFADGETAPESASFARDGRYVVYLSMDSGAREIYIRPYPGPGGRVTVSVNGGVEPRWAPNGEVFCRNAAGDRMFSVSTSRTPTLTVGKPTLLFEGGYYVSPTGSPRAQYDVTCRWQAFSDARLGADRWRGRSCPLRRRAELA